MLRRKREARYAAGDYGGSVAAPITGHSRDCSSPPPHPPCTSSSAAARFFFASHNRELLSSNSRLAPIFKRPVVFHAPIARGSHRTCSRRVIRAAFFGRVAPQVTARDKRCFPLVATRNASYRAAFSFGLGWSARRGHSCTKISRDA